LILLVIGQANIKPILLYALEETTGAGLLPHNGKRRRRHGVHSTFIIVPFVAGFSVDIANAMAIACFMKWLGYQ
jgi:Na+/glutamate symporter